MVLQMANRVRVAVTSTGTGTLSLGAAVGNFLDFTSIASTSQVPYTIEDATGAWEVGQGTYTSGTPGTLTRDTVESSSNGGALVSLTAGAQVYVTPSAGTYGLPAVGVPLINGTGAIGTSGRFARGDHVHPTDTSRVEAAGFRNALINGTFDYWQRGTSFTATGYNADRWTHTRDGSGATVTISRVAVTDAPVWVAGFGLSWYWNYNCTVAGSGGTTNQLTQKIEGARAYAGRTVTLSFFAKSTNGASITPQLAQFFGTGGSPSATAVQAGSAIALTTTATRYSQTFTLPTGIAATKGTNGDDALLAAFNLPLNAVANVAITGVQLEPGGVATSFERRPEGAELHLCQRYFQPGAVWWSGSATGASSSVGYYETFGTIMRAVPTIAFTSPTYTNASGVGANSIAATGFQAFAVATATGLAVFNAQYTASAEL